MSNPKPSPDPGPCSCPNPKYIIHYTNSYKNPNKGNPYTLEHTVWNHPNEVGLMGRHHKNGGTVFEFEPTGSNNEYRLKFVANPTDLYDPDDLYKKGSEQYVYRFNNGYLYGIPTKYIDGNPHKFTVEWDSDNTFQLKIGNEHVYVRNNQLVCNKEYSTKFTRTQVVDMGELIPSDNPTIIIYAKHTKQHDKWSFKHKEECKYSEDNRIFYGICRYSTDKKTARATIKLVLESDSGNEYYLSVNHRLNEDTFKSDPNSQSRTAMVNIARRPDAQETPGTDSLWDHITLHVVPKDKAGKWGDPTLILKRIIT